MKVHSWVTVFGQQGKEAEARIGRRHAVALTGLDPGSTYHYRVEGVGASSATGCFRTAPAGDNSRFSFAVVGDSGSGGKGQLAVAALLERLRPDLVLHTGDVVYPTGQERYYDSRFFAPYRNLIKTVPLFPVLGNHDVSRKSPPTRRRAGSARRRTCPYYGLLQDCGHCPSDLDPRAPPAILPWACPL